VGSLNIHAETEDFSVNAALAHALEARGRDAAGFPNGLATMWFFLTENRVEADRIVRDRLVPAVQRAANPFFQDETLTN
jgi:hypothetical protein